MNIHTITKVGVRLDDLTASRVLGQFTVKELNEYRPAKFDTKGMIRAVRVPLGDASKMYVHAGEIDADGKTVESADEGWYYKWWGGIHLLCGEEGFETYMIRPSFKQMGKGFSFKLSHRAKIQAPEGIDENQIEEVTGKEENATDKEIVDKREIGDKKEIAIKEENTINEKTIIEEEAATNQEGTIKKENAVKERTTEQPFDIEERNMLKSRRKPITARRLRAEKIRLRVEIRRLRAEREPLGAERRRLMAERRPTTNRRQTKLTICKSKRVAK